MKLVKILPALAVFAAAGMTAAGCSSPAGEGVVDEAAFTGTGRDGSAGGIMVDIAEEDTPVFESPVIIKPVTVKFEVLNGGWGLWKSEGIVSTQDDNYTVYGSAVFSRDFYITIPVPEGDEYLNIRWRGTDGVVGLEPVYTMVKAKLKATKSKNVTITLDYNGWGNNVATKNLYDTATGNSLDKYFYFDWEDAKDRSVNR